MVREELSQGEKKAVEGAITAASHGDRQTADKLLRDTVPPNHVDAAEEYRRVITEAANKSTTPLIGMKIPEGKIGLGPDGKVQTLEFRTLGPIDSLRDALSEGTESLLSIPEKLKKAVGSTTPETTEKNK